MSLVKRWRTGAPGGSLPGRGSPSAVARLVVVVAAIVVAGAVVAGAWALTHRPDPQAQDALFLSRVTAQLGKAPGNPSQMITAARNQCDASAASLKYLAGLIRDNANTNVRTITTIGISVYCPDRSAEFMSDLRGK